MKKIVLTAAIVLGSLTAMNAQTGEKDSTPTQQETPATDSYTEIKIEEIPAAITDALKKAYPEAIINKAYVSDKKEYKLEVKVGEKVGALYADENGKWIQK
ncbi:hypothetical protein [Flavobacterium flavipallidum]|uniref:Beta-lactamase-inhibitor-like, PepSY-like n=1 Tax=Flavobacterium flavipallidum TaxID=3139140 RepID=A0ABU9HMM4_9FLAO